MSFKKQGKVYSYVNRKIDKTYTLSKAYPQNEIRTMFRAADQWTVLLLFLLPVFPGHALHEKGLQRQIGIGPLVGSQERRALLVPVLNRLQTAYQPLVNS